MNEWPDCLSVHMTYENKPITVLVDYDYYCSEEKPHGNRQEIKRGSGDTRVSSVQFSSVQFRVVSKRSGKTHMRSIHHVSQNCRQGVFFFLSNIFQYWYD